MANYEATSKGLFKDGKPIVPEFGNPDQIKAVRKFEKRMADLTGEGLEYYPEYEFKAKIHCICGNRISYTEDIPEGDDPSEFEPGHHATCYNCKSKYSLDFDHDKQEHIIKLLKKGEETE